MVPFLRTYYLCTKGGRPKLTPPQTAQDATEFFATARHATTRHKHKPRKTKSTRNTTPQHNTPPLATSHKDEHEGIVKINVKQKLYQTTRAIFSPVRSVNCDHGGESAATMSHVRCFVRSQKSRPKKIIMLLPALGWWPCMVGGQRGRNNKNYG